MAELHYFRHKRAQGKPDDIKKALALYSRSISLAPKNPRAPKTLVRVAQCLAKTNRHTDARRVLDKVKADYPESLTLDLEQEYNKISEVIQK